MFVKSLSPKSFILSNGKVISKDFLLHKNFCFEWKNESIAFLKHLKNKPSIVIVGTGKSAHKVELDHPHEALKTRDAIATFRLLQEEKRDAMLLCKAEM